MTEKIEDMLTRIAIEELAKLEHEQWGHWMEFLDKNKIGQPNHPEFNGLMWDRCMRLSKTPYKELTEQEKESDRVWARKVLAVLGLSEKEVMKALLAAQIQPLCNVTESITHDGTGVQSVPGAASPKTAAMKEPQLHSSVQNVEGKKNGN